MGHFFSEHRYPDYDRSLVSLIRQISAHFGVECGVAGGIHELSGALSARPRSVALLVFDGLGVAQLERYLPQDSFLRAHLAASISSVFPPTTVAAMNSLYSTLAPIQHGWLGWSLWFKEASRPVDVFPRVDSVTKRPLPDGFDPWKTLEYLPVVDRIAMAGHPVRVVAPEGIRIPGSSLDPTFAPDLDAWFSAVGEAGTAGETGPVGKAGTGGFTFGYWPEPDSLLHHNGGSSPKVFETVRELDERCARLAGSLPEDTLLVITADHGHVDVDEYVDIGQIEGLAECLIMAPWLEARSTMFQVKNDRRARFEAAFARSLSRDFILFRREELTGTGLFGAVSDAWPIHPKSDDFIADYLAVATGSRALGYYEPKRDHEHDFPSHHAGGSRAELEIPLVLCRGGRRPD